MSDIERTVSIDSAALREIGGFLPIPRALASRPDLTAAAKLAYGQMLAYGWEKEFSAPAQDRLAEDLAMSERNVRYVLGELRDVGLLTWVRRGQGRPNLYIVKLPAKFADQDRQSASGQERHDRQPASGLERQPASGPSIEEKKGIEKEIPRVSSEQPANTATPNGLDGRPRTTWLTPYADAWTTRFGGKMPCSKFSKPLSEVRAQLGDEEALRRWQNYLAASGTWANASNFASTIGDWAHPKGSVRQVVPHPDQRPDACVDRYAEDEAIQREQQERRHVLR